MLLTMTQKSGRPQSGLSAITINLLVLRGSLSELHSPPDCTFTLKMKTVLDVERSLVFILLSFVTYYLMVAIFP